MKEKTRAFLIPLGLGAVLSAAVYLLAGSQGTNPVQRLCDSFFVSGVLVAGSGGLLFARNEGLFDIFGYSVKSLFGIRLLWQPAQEKEKENYAAYKERKRQRRKSPAGTLLAGAVYLVLALVMLLVYYW
jgi:hypothetical protein